MIHATRDFTVKTVQKAADLAMQAGSRLYTDSASSYRLITGYAHDSVNHTKKEYARGDVHENRAECLFSLLKPYLRVFRGISKTNLPGYVGFFLTLCRLIPVGVAEVDRAAGAISTVESVPAASRKRVVGHDDARGRRRICLTQSKRGQRRRGDRGAAIHGRYLLLKPTSPS